MALPPQPLITATIVPRALSAIEEAKVELPSRGYAAFKAVAEALVSLARELQDVHEAVFRLESRVSVLEADQEQEVR